MQSYGDFHSIPRNITISFPTCMDKRLNLGQIRERGHKVVQCIYIPLAQSEKRD
jgi:hypothetical protein